MFSLLSLIPAPIMMYIRIGFAAILATGIGICIYYWHYSQDKIAALAASNAQLQSTVAVQQTTLNNMQQDIQKANNLLIAYDGRLTDIANQSAILRQKFNALNIPTVAKADPAKAQQLLNDSLNDTFTRIEGLSGIKAAPVPKQQGGKK